MSMEPSRAACSRISSLVNITGVQYNQNVIGALQVQNGKRRSGNWSHV
jgi:hypothetical protein